MEVGSDVALSVILEAMRQAMIHSETLHPSNLVLKTCTDESMEVKGAFNTYVYSMNQREIFIFAVSSDGPSLIEKIGLNKFALIGAIFSQYEL